MKKKAYLYGILILVILCLTTGCKKKVISQNDVTIVANNYNFKINNDITETTLDGVNSMTVLTDNNENMIIFYVFNNEEIAKKTFDTNIKDMKDNYNEKDIKIKSKSNYNTALINDKSYFYVSQVDNTILYIIAKTESAKNMNKLIKDIGY